MILLYTGAVRELFSRTDLEKGCRAAPITMGTSQNRDILGSVTFPVGKEAIMAVSGVNIWRRTIAYAVLLPLLGRLSYQLPYEPDLRDRLFGSPWQSVGLLTLSILALAALIWCVASPVWWRTILAFVLGLGASLWGNDLLGGIEWQQILLLLGILIGIMLFWVLTTWLHLFYRPELESVEEPEPEPVPV